MFYTVLWQHHVCSLIYTSYVFILLCRIIFFVIFVHCLTQYSGSIDENTANVEVMRFKVLDADEPDSDNSVAVFDIISGNDDGIFSVKTDPKTNEGILMLEKVNRL